MTTDYPTITTQSQLATQIAQLIQIAPEFSDIYAQTGLPDIRRREEGFEHLCRVIVSQQLSVAAAGSIWQRLVEQSFTEADSVLAAGDERLKACGLSKQKIRYVKSLAEHGIDYAALRKSDNAGVIKALTAVTGIGAWTAEIYCLFSLNRTDVFAHNDLALQVATQSMRNLDKRPNEREMRNITASWSPHRSAAAYLLWQYYAVLKRREGVL